MPTYDYGCVECDHVFELFLPLSRMDEPLTQPCPNCGKEGSIHKIIGAPVVHWSFMGSTIQSSKMVPEGFKDRLREIKKNVGGKAAKGIEL
jgi:putative FmdB family regulatory protein